MSASAAPEIFPGHDSGAWLPVLSQIVAAWPVGHFAENLAMAANGDVFVTIHTHSRIDRWHAATGEVTTFATFPAPVAGIACAPDGILWVTGGVLGQAPGFIWKLGPDGQPMEWAQVQDAVFLNGCTFHPDGRHLLVCESMTGRVLAIDLTQPGHWSVWITSDELRSASAQVPGANGVKILGDHAIVTVTDKSRVLRAVVLADGSAGPLEPFAENLRADDFAVAADGTLYITTHPANSVLRLAPDGSRTTIAGPAEGAVGSTSCALAGHKLFVTTNGGLWSPYRGVPQEAKLLCLDLSSPA